MNLKSLFTTGRYFFTKMTNFYWKWWIWRIFDDKRMKLVTQGWRRARIGIKMIVKTKAAILVIPEPIIFNKYPKMTFFRQKWPIFYGLAIFKGMIHVTRGRARVATGIKLFVCPRALILAIIDVWGPMGWHLAANLVTKIGKTTPSSGENFLKNFSDFNFQIYLISPTSHLLNSNLEKTY